MNKGLDLIQRQKIEMIDGYPTGNIYIGLTSEELEELEKELKTLEIIKEKKVYVVWLRNGLSAYNSTAALYKLPRLTEEEYDLLKEVLL